MKQAIFFFALLSFVFSQTCVKKLTQDQINAILDAHNSYRNTVASGSQTISFFAGGQLPSSSNMKVVEWSTDLEELAQSWANTDPGSHNPTRKVSNPNLQGYIGENIFWGWSSSSRAKLPGSYAAQSAVKSWFDEYKQYRQSVDKFVSDGTMIGHLTQVIWAETTKIGCGILDCVTSHKNTYYTMYLQKVAIVCNYWKGGNYIGAAVYEKGTPCSKCTCSSKYTSLCA